MPGAQLSDVRRVVSHTQALGQCAKYIKKHGFEKTECENTALAARIVAKENDKSLAAIASAETAKLYDLIVLDHDINESAVNSTRFAVFTRTARKTPDADKFILLFTVNDVAGALASAINVISSHGFNMKALKSRPVHDKAWQYYFYVEAEGDDESEDGRTMLEELSKNCEIIKIAGHYKEEILRTEEDV